MKTTLIQSFYKNLWGILLSSPRGQNTHLLVGGVENADSNGIFRKN